jgi:hypothetical protein
MTIGETRFLPFRQMLDASADIGERRLGSLHTEQPSGALQAVEELTKHLITDHSRTQITQK